MIQIAVLDDYQGIAKRITDWSALKNCEVVAFSEPLLGVDAASASLRDFDIVCLMRERTPFPRQLIESLPKLRCLVTTGPRNASIDLAAAQAKGVTVCHTRGGGTEHGTTELAWALILACTRHLVYEHNQVMLGHWQTTIGPMLWGKTLGLVGLGRIGGRMAEIGRAFGMHIIAWSPNLDAARAAISQVVYVPKQELFERSDVVSLHLALAETTKGIIGTREFDAMQAHAILINTARAALINEQALMVALRTGKIAGAGLDVFHEEPLRPGHPLLKMERVVLSPHLGYVTVDSYQIFFQDVVEDIVAFLAGAPIRVLQH